MCNLSAEPQRWDAMTSAVIVVRIEADVDEFLGRARSAHRRFTWFSLCYL